MKTLTVRQPWAALIAGGAKTIEVRRWATDYRGPLLIHAGRAEDPCSARVRRAMRGLPDALTSARGEVVALVELVDVRPFVPDDAAAALVREGEYAWVLERPRAFAHPVRATGRLGLFDLDQARFDWRNTA